MQPKIKDPGNEFDSPSFHSHLVTAPPLPNRPRHDNRNTNTSSADDGIFVIAAPAAEDSEPTTPMTEQTPSGPLYMPPWVDDVDEEDEKRASKDIPDSLFVTSASSGPPKLPRRKSRYSEDKDEGIEPPAPRTQAEPPRLPKRQAPHRKLSTSPEEDSHQLPSWVAAQESEARARSTFVDEDTGV